MRRFELSRCCRLAVGVVMGLAMNAAAQADETGVVRISDRTAQPVIRAQSPDRSLIEQTNCQSGAYDTSRGPLRANRRVRRMGSAAPATDW